MEIRNALTVVPGPASRLHGDQATHRPDRPGEAAQRAGGRDAADPQTATQSETSQAVLPSRRQDGRDTQTGSSPRVHKPAHQEHTPEERRILEALKRRDAQIRSREAAQQAAAEGLSRGGAQFSYEVGPDGHAYAVDGEVPLDTSPIPGDPDATAQKMRRIQRAALAAQPSARDFSVAAEAGREAKQAEQEARQAMRDKDRLPGEPAKGVPRPTRVEPAEAGLEHAARTAEDVDADAPSAYELALDGGSRRSGIQINLRR